MPIPSQSNSNRRPGGPGGQRPGGNRRPGGPGGRGPRRDEPKDEFKERVLDMRRVTRVVKGGKRFRFRATIVIGDFRGRVGVGIGKGADVQQAVAKAKVDAKKNLISLFKARVPGKSDLSQKTRRLLVFYGAF